MDITDEERSQEQRERDESRRRGIHEDAPSNPPSADRPDAAAEAEEGE